MLKVHAMFKLIVCSGFLFIGDPHVCSKAPGRRKDDYLSSVLRKLEDAAEIANRLNLQAVITGDLLHVAYDNALKMLNRLAITLKKFERAPITLGGNHDKDQFKLSEEDTLLLLHNTGLVRVVDEASEIGLFQIDDEVVRLWACPDYAEIPEALPAFEGKTIMVSHHNMAFERAYPTSIPLSEIKNCAMVVNGHMHDTKKPQQTGGTLWCNPGNIEPLSVDLKDHVPCVWQWHPSNKDVPLIPHVLAHGSDLFNLEGLQVTAASAEDGVAAFIEKPARSRFVELSLAQSNSDISQTEDGSVLKEDLVTTLATLKTSDPAKALLESLFSQIEEANFA